MIRNLLLVVILASINASVLGQTNYFTPGNNGTFETAGSENAFVNASGGNFVFSRSSTVKYAGSYSLKITSAAGSTNRYMKIAAPFGTTQTFYKSIKTRLYVSSASNLDPNTRISIEVVAYNASSNGGHQVFVCNYKDFKAGVDPYNTWVEIYSEGLTVSNPTSQFDVHVMVDNLTGSAEFYLDNIELTTVTGTNPGQVVDRVNRNIVLNPTGVYGGGYPATAFTYVWSDGSTQKDRFGLAPGSYTVQVIQSNGTERPCSAPIQTIGFTCVNNLNLCGDATGTLTAGCDPAGTTYQWYTDELVGTLVGTGNNLPIGPLLPGTYSYWAQPILAGQTFPRAQAIVRVYAIPSPDLAPDKTVAYIGQSVIFTAANHQTGNSYAFTYTYNSLPVHVNSTIAQTSISLPAVGVYAIECVTTDINGCTVTNQFTIEMRAALPLCQSIVPTTNTGTLKLDKFSGQVVFTPAANCAEDLLVGCVGGKVVAPFLNNVVAATATAYSDDWGRDFLKVSTSLQNALTNMNSFEKSERGKWRPKSTHTFNNPINYQAKERNYEAGVFSLAKFNFQYPEVNKRSGWLLTSNVEKYTPDGDAVEEFNALNIAGATKIGYGGSVPYLVVQNADYGSVYFEGFENIYSGGKLEDNGDLTGGDRVSDNYHSGKAGLSLTGQFKSIRLTVNAQMRTKGLQLRFWVKGDVSTGAVIIGPATYKTGGTPMQPAASGSEPPKTFDVIARSGEWALLESKITGISSDSEELTVSISKGSGAAVWIDDIRIQPLDAEMTCYVYDTRTLQLITAFDDQHFGMFYQYNAEGKLIRKMVETQRGIRTIQEKQYNVPTINKTSPLGN